MIGTDIYFDLAKRNVRLHLLRSVLAAIGIVIGVFAITTMGILGSALQVSVTSGFGDEGGQITVTPAMEGGGFFGGSEEKLSIPEIRKIERASMGNPVVPFSSTFSSIRAAGEDTYASVYGLDPGDIPLVLEVEKGVMIHGGDRALISSDIAEAHDLKIGSRITIGDEEEGKKVRVAGILKNTGFGGGISTYSSIIITDRLYQDINGKDRGYDKALVIVEDLDEVEAVRENLDKSLNGRKETVDISDPKALIEMISGVLGAVSLAVTGIAGISLLVAAVSIFNVMMMSVTERTREIGILRSIGVKSREIIKMFLYEAAILGALGAVIGGVLSLIAGGILVTVMLEDISYLFAPSVLMNVVIGIGVGIGICVLSGVYPAWKASRLSPITALAAE
ncbi:putative ABC transport system permease protein [Methanofollis sp. W23]|uniref:ABC transporter permease n=1 Tax=Methanofollis sp. W23 TaxID=2817849 RepID=UPI001AE7CB46|nr:ABC transporter permease [Methanofollis sp. W23]MBP2146001.1 putative ABC transport system permease protein [Methanofollis sp. W23]